MSDTQKIIEFLDRYIEMNHITELRAVQAAEILDKADILTDSKTKPGLPLRKKLRNGDIPHAYQLGVHWFIPHSNSATVAAVDILKTIQVSKKQSHNDISIDLLKKNNFKSIINLTDKDIPNIPGIYAIRIKNSDTLPNEFRNELKRRHESLLYIGKATTSLRKRLWEEELHTQRPATFFRSIGAILGFLPPKGSLRDRQNQSNYRFSPADNAKIIHWIEENLLVNFVVCNNAIEDIERSIINETTPLINIQNNPNPFNRLIELREKCRDIARS